jgi:hypothetical protein
MKTYPFWVANGLTQSVDDLKANSLSIQHLVDFIRGEFDGKNISIEGTEKKFLFDTKVVMAGPIMQLGLIAMNRRTMMLQAAAAPAHGSVIVDDATPMPPV